MTTEYTKTVLTTEDFTIVSVNETNHKLIEVNSSVIPVVLMFVAGVSGNILAIVLLHKTSEKHKWRAFYRFVVVLMVTDLFGLIGQLPVMISIYANNMKWVGGQLLCDFMGFTSIFTGITSSLFAAAMSLDRFLAVWLPYTYNSRLSSRGANLTIVGMLTFALILAYFPLIGINHNSIQFPGTWCFFDQFSTEPGDMSYVFVTASVGLLMVVLMVTLTMFVTYSLIKRRVLRSKRKLRTGDVYNVVFLVVLMVVFTVCWLPLLIRIILNQSGAVTVNHTYDTTVARLALVNQVIDPWVYILLRKDTIAPIITAVIRFVDCGICLQLESAEEGNSSRRRNISTDGDPISDEELERIGSAYVQCAVNGNGDNNS